MRLIVINHRNHAINAIKEFNICPALCFRCVEFCISQLSMCNYVSLFFNCKTSHFRSIYSILLLLYKINFKVNPIILFRIIFRLLFQYQILIFFFSYIFHVFFIYEFACSPVHAWALSGYPGFLPPSNYIYVKLIGDSKLTLGVSVDMVVCLACLCVALRLATCRRCTPPLAQWQLGEVASWLCNGCAMAFVEQLFFFLPLHVFFRSVFLPFCDSRSGISTCNWFPFLWTSLIRVSLSLLYWVQFSCGENNVLHAN